MAMVCSHLPDTDAGQLRALMAADLTPGARLQVRAVDTALGTLTVEVAGHPLILSLGVAAQVQVHAAGDTEAAQ